MPVEAVLDDEKPVDAVVDDELLAGFTAPSEDADA
jgi:hypothetical protein